MISNFAVKSLKTQSFAQQNALAYVMQYFDSKVGGGFTMFKYIAIAFLVFSYVVLTEAKPATPAKPATAEAKKDDSAEKIAKLETAVDELNKKYETLVAWAQ